MGGSTRRIYPKANTTAQWYEPLFSRGDFPRIEKILLHTTETTGWPGYKGGAVAPTLTYHPRLRQWRQHNFLDRSARALVDPDSTPVRENRDNVIQIEIVCYSDEKLAATVGGLPVSQLTDDMLKDLGDFIGYVRSQWGGPPLVYPPRSNPRMTSAQYDAWQGLCGHDDASGNSHWDPGALNFARIVQHAAAYGGTTITAPQEEDDMFTEQDRADLAYISKQVKVTDANSLTRDREQDARIEALIAAVSGLAEANVTDVTGEQVLALVGGKVDAALADFSSKAEAALANIEITLAPKPEA